MENEKQIRKRVLLRAIGSPIVLAPFLAGMTAMTTALTLGARITIGIFAGVVGTLTAAGTFVTRLILQGDSIAREISEEIASENEHAKQSALDQLDETLSTSDEDPRPEAALRDLRGLLKAFDELGARAEGALVHSMVHIQASAGQLFEQCVHSLAQTDRLWKTARGLHTKSARLPILEQREKMIADVQATVKQLSDTLANLQTLNPGGNPSAELQRLRDELDQSLEVAKNVEARIQSLLTDPAAPQQDHRNRTDSKLKG